MLDHSPGLAATSWSFFLVGIFPCRVGPLAGVINPINGFINGQLGLTRVITVTPILELITRLKTGRGPPWGQGFFSTTKCIDKSPPSLVARLFLLPRIASLHAFFYHNWPAPGEIWTSGMGFMVAWDENVVNQQVLKFIEIPHVERWQTYADMYNLYIYNYIYIRISIFYIIYVICKIL